MHDTALLAGERFAWCYCNPTATDRPFRILDVGGRDVNGSLRQFFGHCEFTCLDIEPHASVDVVIEPGQSIPYPDGYFDAIVSTSCFEHDPCFWITFLEMARVVKQGGYMYVNAPNHGPYHGYPGDNWRFNRDASQALAVWASKNKWPVRVLETFYVLPINEGWIDFVAVWQRTDVSETETNVVLETLEPGPMELMMSSQTLSWNAIDNRVGNAPDDVRRVRSSDLKKEIQEEDSPDVFRKRY